MLSRFIDFPKRCVRYAHRFGPITGPSMLFKMVARQGPGLVSVKLPDLEDAIVLRRHTTDIAAFEQVFISREYELPLHSTDPKFIIDGGAKRGCESILFVKRYPTASIYQMQHENANTT